MQKKPKIGRPKLPKGEAKQVFPIRLSPIERSIIELAAKKAGKKPSEWARSVMLFAAGLPDDNS